MWDIMRMERQVAERRWRGDEGEMEGRWRGLRYMIKSRYLPLPKRGMEGGTSSAMNAYQLAID
jgi:hypothetical protein